MLIWGSFFMAKPRTIYECQKCGAQSPKWLGRCPECAGWNTLTEEVVGKDDFGGQASKGLDAAILEIKGPGEATLFETSGNATSICQAIEESSTRIPSGDPEFDRLLGGGFVPGSLLLLGGDPGVGKSTLLLQIGNQLSEKVGSVLYCSGEESTKQIQMRGRRLGHCSKTLFILAENCFEKILEEAKRIKPKLIVIDSIQTAYTSELESAPGSISQVREVAGRFQKIAKQTDIPIMLIGHLTKDGAIAGPKLLEHMVDTVLYFEGDRGGPFRILRTYKNRFGSTNEIGVFEMKEEGLVPVSNPSQFFLSERRKNVSGSVVISAVEGTRPILVELQALVSSTKLNMPRRTAMGIDQGRMSLMLAIMEKRAKLFFYDQDVFLNVVGGVAIDEPSADLGIIAAVYSSFSNRAVSSDTVFIGEVGLGGEIRAVGQIDMRISEASRLGFKSCILPASNLKRYSRKDSIELIGLESIEGLFEIF